MIATRNVTPGAAQPVPGAKLEDAFTQLKRVEADIERFAAEAENREVRIDVRPGEEPPAPAIQEKTNCIQCVIGISGLGAIGFCIWLLVFSSEFKGQVTSTSRQPPVTSENLVADGSEKDPTSDKLESEKDLTSDKLEPEKDLILSDPNSPATEKSPES